MVCIKEAKPWSFAPAKVLSCLPVYSFILLVLPSVLHSFTHIFRSFFTLTVVDHRLPRPVYTNGVDAWGPTRFRM